MIDNSKATQRSGSEAKPRKDKQGKGQRTKRKRRESEQPKRKRNDRKGKNNKPKKGKEKAWKRKGSRNKEQQKGWYRVALGVLEEEDVGNGERCNREDDDEPYQDTAIVFQ